MWQAFFGQKTLSRTTGESRVTNPKIRFCAQKGESQRSESNRQPPVYKTGALNSQVVVTKKVTEFPENHLATSLAFSLQEYPELDSLVKRWPDLPEHIRQAILCLLK